MAFMGTLAVFVVDGFSEKFSRELFRFPKSCQVLPTLTEDGAPFPMLPALTGAPLDIKALEG